MIKEKTLIEWAARRFGKSKCKRIKFCDNASYIYGNYDWKGTI